MRRHAWWLPLAFVALLGVPAAAQTTPELDIRIERDTRPRPGVTELGVHHIVTITERVTGQPPKNRYAVFGLATNPSGGEQSPSFGCGHVADDDPTIPPGMYLCTVYVDHGGKWNFIAVVNAPKADPNLPPVTVARASAPFELVTEQVYTGVEDDGVKGDASDVALLWGHVLVAGLWFLCVGALAALAVPALRRRLSSLTVNRLEWRLDFLVKLTWGVTAAVIGSGTYLLLNETAYETPFSSSEIDGVFDLPYGKPYYLTLAAKLALYALMVLAVFPLVRGARRQLHLGYGMAAQGKPAPSTAPAGEGTLLTAEAPPVVEQRASLLVYLAAVVTLVGVVGISLCVTLLKYFHQLIEAV